jgi:sigma-B regulation protein RsbU (phosphoserine phosphatase)
MPEASPEVSMLLSDGSLERECILRHTPYTIGRLQDRDLVLTHPYVSREHAQILHEADGYYLQDCGSRHGTYLNGQRVNRTHLTAGDNIRLGSLNGPLLQFDVHDQTSSSIRELLGAFSTDKSTDLEKLRWFLEAARRMNAVGAVDQVLASLVETTLQLTQVERGYVFLRNIDGVMELAVGRSLAGEALSDDSTLSHSAIQQATRTAGEFIVTDTLSAEQEQRTESMVAQSIRTIICIPLRSRLMNKKPRPDGTGAEILGVLYLDDRLKAGTLTKVDADLLQTIATEAAALVENAQLAREEEEARRYREELNIAAGIQQGLMMVQIPKLPYATVSARSIACKEIGGDFFDLVANDDSLSVVVADVSGKGVSAALLASTLQGMIYSQLQAGQSLTSIVTLANRYICTKDINKYATMVILRLSRRGTVEYVNCGHVQPLLLRNGKVEALKQSNLPVGMLKEADYDAAMISLEPNDRILIVTDGVTEAENPEGEFFGDERLEAAVAKSKNMEDIFQTVQEFSLTAPANDDCTMLEVWYTRN